ncbi:hypothetical protein [Lentzea sp. NEAU-D7]|uniref:hypothetical protein n=1 Tax=Lentzea sp. NEAU-D7 TaxID=2994667 RepID=UPI00224B0AAD|nr:hypothetical protein [Lentzea sp. NEAU-D7]MCX2952753.1 hypothetical protein [Lentzea sp. NEAU-D7]
MGLVTFEGRDVGFTDALSRVAEQLKPLGAAGRCVAETYALATEIREVRAAKAVDDRDVRLAVLDQRRRESTATLRGMQKELGRAGKSAAALRECMVNMQRATVKPGLELAERRAYIDLTQHFTTMLVQHHSELTGGVANVIDKVLNGSGATALAPARRKPRRAR